MAQTTSTSSNFGNFPQEHVRRELLKKGDRDLAYHAAAKKIPYPKGENKTMRFGRYDAVEVALQSLTEGTNPTPQAMTISQVTASLSQYGKSIRVTDVHEMTVMHPTFQQATDELGRSLRDTRDYLLQETLNAESNVIYPGSVSGRGSITSSDVPTGKEIRRGVSKLKNPDSKGRAAPRFGRDYKFIWHEKLEQDLMDDPTWSAQAVRNMQGVSDLQEGTFGRWAGAQHISTNYSPEFQNLGDPTIADNTAVVQGDLYTGAPSVLVGLTIDAKSTTDGSLSASTAYDFTVTAIHKHRGFEELVSGVIDHSTGSGEDTFTVTFPDDDNYVYNLYFGSDGGTRRLVTSYQEADSTFDVTSVPGSGDTAPTPPAEGVTVYTGHGFGMDAFANIELDVERALISQGPDSNNNLALYRTVGYKFFDGNVVLNSNWLQRVEAASNFT